MNRILYSVIFLATVIANTTNTFNEPDIWSHSLVKRASNDADFNWFVDKMSLSARVMTGISLEIGLMDSSIPADAAVSEMLNIGEATLEDVETFDKSDLDKSIDELEAVSGKLSNRGTLQRGLRVISAMKKMWAQVGDLSKVVDRKKRNVLKHMITPKLPFIQLGKFYKNSTELLQAKSNKTEMKRILNFTSEIIGNLDTIHKQVKPEGVIEFVNSLKPLRMFAELLEVFIRTFDGTTISQASADDITDIKDDFDLYQFLSLGSASWKSLKSISASRLAVNLKKYTSGFVNGFKDLDTLPNDIKDKLFGGKVPELKNLIALKANLAKLDGSFEKIGDTQSYRVLETMERLSTLLEAVKNSNGEADVVINALASCSVPTDNSRAYILPSFKSHLQEGKKLIKDFEVLKKLSKLVTKEDKDHLKKAMADGSGIEKVAQLLDKIEPWLRQKDYVGLSRAAKDLQDLDTTDLLSSFQDHRKFFECLTKVGKSGEERPWLVSTLSTEIRKLDTEFFKSIRLVSSSLGDSIPIAQDVRKTLNSAKDSKSEKLMKLKEIQKVSENFGEAVTILVMARKAIEPNTRDTLSLSITMEHRYVEDSMYDYLLMEDVLKTYKDEESATSFSNGLLAAIDIAKSKTKKPSKADSFADFAPLFAVYSDLPSVELRTHAKLITNQKIVDAISTGNTMKGFLAGYLKSHWTIGKLDLEFSKYSTSVKGISDTLLDLDQVMGGKPAGPAGRPGTQAAQAGAAGGANGSSGGGSGSTLIIVGVVVGVLVVLGVIIGVVIYLKKKKKNKEKNKESSEGGKKNGSKEENEQKSPGDGGDGDASPASPSPSPAGSKEVGGSKEGSKEAGSKEKVKGSNERADGGAELLV